MWLLRNVLSSTAIYQPHTHTHTGAMTPCLSHSPQDASQSWSSLLMHHMLSSTPPIMADWLVAWLATQSPMSELNTLAGIKAGHHPKTWPCINIATICVPSSLLPLKFRKKQSQGEEVGVERNRVWADGVRIKVGWIDAAARTCQQWQMDVAKMKQVRH